MSWLIELARPQIRALHAYEHAVWEPGLVRLHANELPWRAHNDASLAGLNSYPEPHPQQLTAALAQWYGVPPAMLLAGRGSDELIDLLIRSFCRADQDAVLICPPTFGMYSVAAHVQGAAVLEVPLLRSPGWQADYASITARICDAADARLARIKLVFLCSPNNPTGNQLEAEAILALARTLEGRALIVVDEAYVEFAQQPSLVARVAETPALVVLRTLSKAHGLAGARCGVVIAHVDVISLLRKVIQPYAITQLSIEAVFRALQPEALAQTQHRIELLRKERMRVAAALQSSPGVRRVWPSEANFLLVDFADAGAVLARSHHAGLLLRDLRATRGLDQALRITIGTPEQNERLLASVL